MDPLGGLFGLTLLPMMILSVRHIHIRKNRSSGAICAIMLQPLARSHQKMDTQSPVGEPCSRHCTYEVGHGYFLVPFRGNSPQKQQPCRGQICLTPLHPVCYGQHVLIVRLLCLERRHSSGQYSPRRSESPVARLERFLAPHEEIRDTGRPGGRSNVNRACRWLL